MTALKLDAEIRIYRVPEWYQRLNRLTPGHCDSCGREEVSFLVDAVPPRKDFCICTSALCRKCADAALEHYGLTVEDAIG